MSGAIRLVVPSHEKSIAQFECPIFPTGVTPRLVQEADKSWTDQVFVLEGWEVENFR